MSDEIIRALEDIRRELNEAAKDASNERTNIAASLATIVAEQKGIKESINKYFWLLVAAVGASLGKTFIASPFWLDTYAYSLFFVLIFALGVALASKRYWLSLSTFSYGVVAISAILAIDVGDLLVTPLLMSVSFWMFGLGTTGIAVHSWKEYKRRLREGAKK